MPPLPSLLRRLVQAFLLLVALTRIAHGQSPASEVLSFPALADTYVDAGAAGTNFNASAVLLAGTSPTRIAYLRFNVTGLAGRSVQQARLRLQVARASVEGSGSLHLISDGAWAENTLTWTTRAKVDGPAVATVGPVPTVGQVVEFVLDGAIRSDGVYNLALDNAAVQAAGYVSNAGASGQKPTLVLTVASSPNPTVRIVQPATNATFFEGDPVTLQATASDPTDGDLGAVIEWRSSLQAYLGTGATVTTPLARGNHTITATVTDRGGLKGSARLSLSVVPRPPANTAPLVAITAPLDGATLFAEQSIAFAGSANDLEDGPLTPRLTWSSDRDGALGTGGTVQHALTIGTHKITARATDAAGLQGKTTATVTAIAPGTLEFLAEADAYVDAAAPASNFGGSPVLRVYAGSSRRAYLRFTIRGVGRQQVTRAILQLRADSASSAASDSGGSLYGITDSWQESGVTAGNAPALAGGAIASTGRISSNQVVTFDVSSVVTGDGTYDFSLSSESLDEVVYRSRESKNPPTMTVTITGHPPAVAITAPAPGSALFAGTPVALAATATDAEDGPLGGTLRWSSTLDGVLGSGPQLTRTLKAGLHTLTASATDSDGRTGQAQTTIRVRAPNVAPKVVITAPTGKTTTPAGAPVTLSATVTDDFDPNPGPRLQWMSSRDGFLGAGTPRSTTLSEGTHVLTATVTDSDGAVGAAQMTFVVTPSPPAVTITSPATGKPFFTDAPMVLSATAIDATDGNLSPAIVWTSDVDGALGTGASLRLPPLSLGARTITAAVTDAGGLRGQAQRVVLVRPPNLPPALTIDAPADGLGILAGKPLLLAATARDAENGDLGATVTWTSSRDGAIGKGALLTPTKLSTGTHTLTASVADQDGVVATSSVTVTVAPATVTFPAIADTYVDASAPTRAFGTASGLFASATPGQRAFLRFAARGLGAFPVDHAIVRLTVGTSSSDGSSSGGSLQVLTDHAWTEATTYTTRPAPGGVVLSSNGKVTAKQVVDFDVTTALDGDGGYDFALTSTIGDPVRYQSRETSNGPKLIVTFRQDLPPMIRITAPAPGAKVAGGTPVVLAARAYDPEGRDLSARIAWSSSLAGALGSGASLTVPALAPGTHTITATVTQPNGTSGRAEVTVRVRGANQAPTIVITAPADHTSVTAGTSVTLTAIPTDEWDADLRDRVVWSSSRDGDLGTGAVQTAILSEGMHVVTATVTDLDGASASATLICAITPTPPVVTILAPATGAIVTAGTSVTFTGTATDVTDGDLAAALSWASDRDGPLGTGTPLTARLRPGTHQITASVEDAGGLVGKAVRTLVVNAPPILAIVPPADGSLFLAGQPFRISATATDPEDGDLQAAITWNSDRDGALGTGAPIGIGGLSAGPHVLTARVTDRAGATVTASLPLVIAPSTLTFAPVADTYVDSGSATARFGTTTELLVGTAPTRQALLRFAVAGVAPFAVGTASLQLRTGSGSADGSKAGTGITVLGDGAWAENTTTWVTRPAIPATLLVTGPPAQSNQTVSFDVTPAVRGDGTVGLALTSTSSDWVRYASREAGLAGPRLVVTLRQSAPTVTIYRPTTGTTVFTGEPVNLFATAVDPTDGDVAPTLTWTSDRDGALGQGASITTRTLGAGMHTIVAAAANRHGIVGTARVTLTVLPGALAFVPVADTYVDQLLPASAFGGSPTLGAVGPPGIKKALIRFVVSGIGQRPVADAHLELTVRGLNTASGTGGVLQRINDNTWSEATTTWMNAPSTTGTVLDSVLLPVLQNQVVPFRLGTTATKDGTYNLALTSPSIDAVKYASRESATPPRLVITFRPPVSTAPTITITVPPAPSWSAFDDESITFTASALDPKDGVIGSSVTWRSSLDGTLGTGATLARVLTRGTHVVTATTRNRAGATATTAVTVTVRDRPPALRIATPAAGALLPEGRPVTFTGTATDNADGDLGARIRWASDRDGEFGTGASLTVPALSYGDHVVTATITNSLGTTATATLGIAIGNASPRLQITAPSDATTVPEGTHLTLSGTASDPEDGDLGSTIVWTSDVQGLLGRGGTVPMVVAGAGRQHVTASIRDAAGVERTATITVTGTLAPPVLTILSPADGSSFPGSFTLAARATDVRDGDRSAQIRWRSNLSGMLGRGGVLPVRGLAFGHHLIAAEVTDSDGLTTTQTIGVTIGNTAPVVTITAPGEGTSVSVWTPLTFRATALDGLEGDVGSTIRWTSNLSGPLGTGPSITVATLPRGTHLVTAVATDSQGLGGLAQVIVTISGGALAQPPRVAITAPANGVVLGIGTPVTFTGTAAGPGGDLSATLTWTSSRDGWLGTGGTVTVATLSPGTHRVTATASDTAGNTGSATIDVTVTAVPLSFRAVADASTDQLQPTTPLGLRPFLELDGQPLQRVYLRFAVTNLPPGPISRAIVRLRVSSGTAAGSDLGGELHGVSGFWDEGTLTHANKPVFDGPALAAVDAVTPGQAVDFDVTRAVTAAGTYAFGLRTTSPNGAQYLAREAGAGGPVLLVYVDPPAPSRPIVHITTPTGAPLATGAKPVAFGAVATHPQDGDVGARVVWRSDRDGVLGTGASLTHTLSAGAHVITATVTDRAGVTGGDVVRVVVGTASNGPAQVTILSPASGTSVAIGTPVALTAVAGDGTGADVSSSVQWTSNLDGVLGTGPALVRVLRPGSHTLTAALPGTGKKPISTSIRLDVTTARVGTEDFSFGPNIEVSLDKATATKQQSRLWVHDGVWWACLFVPARSAIRIHRLDPATQTWLDTGVEVDERGKSRQDVLVDGDRLYVASRFGFVGAPPQNRFLRFTYHPAAETYALDPGFPIDIPGGGAEALTVAKDSRGALWITYVLNGTLFVTHTLGNDTVWTPPFTPPVSEGTTAEPDDDAAVVALPKGRIGIFWSNQLLHKFYFATHIDGAADGDKAAWRLETVSALPDVADDHFNLKLASDGRLFVAVKTSINTPGRPQVGLFVRSAAGAWSPFYPVVNYEEGPTRPTCLLDEVSRRVYVAYSSFMADIYYKASDMDAIAFPQGGVGTPLMVSGTHPAAGLNDPISTKQTLDPATGLLVLASTSETNRYWHGWITLPTPRPTVTITAPAPDAHVAPGAVVRFTGTAVSPNDGGLDARLRWTSDRDGPVGSGASITVARLSPGTHRITATAIDGSRLTGEAAISITVDAPLLASAGTAR